jgi:hypothetical protein
MHLVAVHPDVLEKRHDSGHYQTDERGPDQVIYDDKRLGKRPKTICRRIAHIERTLASHTIPTALRLKFRVAL